MTIPHLAACEADIKHRYVSDMQRTCDTLFETAIDMKLDYMAKLKAILRPSLAA
jgi:hypothetical protein